MMTIGDVASEQRKHVAAMQRREIIDWLAPINFFQRQADISRGRQPGTGLWLLEDVRFKQWKAGSEPVLWCRGMPGSGKTVLVSLAVDHLEAQFRNTDIGVASMYLNHKDADTQTLSNLLASLWRQLVADKPISIPTHELHQRHSEKRTRPTFDEIFAILRSTVAEWSRVYLVVDALDEYPEDERNTLLEHLTALGPIVSLMLTSRPHITPPALLPNVAALEIRAADKDIRKYIEERIKKSNRLSMHIRMRPDLRNEIEEKIISVFDGMFLLAKLHIDSLATKSTIKALREALETLPKDLEHTYDEAMERINRQSEDDRKIALAVLTWVANTKRVLSITELREALAIEPGATSFDPDNLLDINIILSVCAGLIIVEETSSAVRLVHYTTQGYLDKVQNHRFPEAHTTITLALLTYLTFALPDRERLDYHGGNVDYYASHQFSQQYPLLNYYDLNKALIEASTNGFTNIVSLLIKKGANVNADNVLVQATYRGHTDVVRLLLEAGADGNAADVGYASALQTASAIGHADIVSLLIKAGAHKDS
ncbi:hypothetical protein B0H19DRAFT_1041260 [Mycena capillaripes]|nr:hypothetical protein B0H19DRAFT_1041260 [Mycena capillaripes]